MELMISQDVRVGVGVRVGLGGDPDGFGTGCRQHFLPVFIDSAESQTGRFLHLVSREEII